MKNIIFLLLPILFLGCANQKENELKQIDFYSTKVDTLYSLSDRTKIDEIKRFIYDKKINDGKYGLNLHTELKKGKPTSFALVKVIFKKDLSSEAYALTFKNIAEVKSLFSKIDSLKVGNQLKERKKVKHYEIDKTSSSIHIKQFATSVDIPFEMYLRNIEFEGLKMALERFEKE